MKNRAIVLHSVDMHRLENQRENMAQWFYIYMGAKKAPCEGARSCLLDSLIDRYPMGYFL